MLWVLTIFQWMFIPIRYIIAKSVASSIIKVSPLCMSRVIFIPCAPTHQTLKVTKKRGGGCLHSLIQCTLFWTSGKNVQWSFIFFTKYTCTLCTWVHWTHRYTNAPDSSVYIVHLCIQWPAHPYLVYIQKKSQLKGIPLNKKQQWKIIIQNII